MTGQGRFILKKTIGEPDPRELGAYLQGETGLSRGAIKNALAKGALRLAKGARGPFRRVRKADASLAPGDRVELGYDPELLARVAPSAELLLDVASYTFWLKPAGLLAQGNEFGDHCSILRQVELWAHRADGRQTFLAQRLDRETVGVMVFAHDRRAAAELSGLLAADAVRKSYRAVVHGRLELRGGTTGRFDASLDGLAALTEYEVLSYDAERGRSTVAIVLHGGRLHQIRRHFAAAGFPLVGDPRYGRGDGEPLRLAATAVWFPSELLGREVGVELPAERAGF